MLLPVLLAAVAPVQVVSDPLASEFELVPDRLTIVLEDPSLDAEALLARVASPALTGATILRANRLGNVDIQLAPGADLDLAVDSLAGVAGVSAAERIYLGRYHGVPNDPLFGNQDHLRNLGQTGGTLDADVDAEHAWAISTGDPDIVIAVIDSGTETTHPDLAPNIWVNPGEIPGNGVDDDGNGFVDDVQGWSFENGIPNPAGGSHGTWVAGVVGAASNNGIGIAGLAGGDGAKRGCQMMCMGIGAFSPDPSLLDDAILYAIDNGARVITLSLSAPESASLNNAFKAAFDAGLFLDCAAGNGFFGSGPVSYPATHPNVVAVGGTTHDDVFWTGANSGPEVRVSAQAENVYTTAVGGGYEPISGTSFAAPQVGALAGLILSVNPDLTPLEVLFLMAGTADDVGAPGFDNQTGLGRINAWRALLAASNPDCDGNGEIDAFEIAMGMAVDTDGDDRIDSCQSLFPGKTEVSLASGGNVDFTLSPTEPGIDGDAYYLLGSLTGPTPAVSIGGLELPLVADAYTTLALTQAGIPPFVGFVGVIDPVSSSAAASLQLAPGTAPSLVGQVLYHAYLTQDLTTFEFSFVSNLATTELLP
ncbi:MAG: S8 family serine peptidase [Planctomycetota bacterium]|jgi:hypothetical protein